MDLIVLTVAEKDYAFDISQIIKVIRVRQIVPVPETADFVEGVINFSNSVLPIINLRVKLGLGRKAPDKFNRIVISHAHGHAVGILIESAKKVVKIDPAQVAPPEELLKEARYLTGVAKIGKDLVLIIDIDKLLFEEHKAIKEIHGRVEVRKKK